MPNQDSLPEFGEMEKPLPEVNDTVYGMVNEDIRMPWRPCTVIEPVEPGAMVKVEVQVYNATSKENRKEAKDLSLKQIAYFEKCKVRYQVGTRVLAKQQGVSNIFTVDVA